jgi:hypothetical protein
MIEDDVPNLLDPSVGAPVGAAQNNGEPESYADQVFNRMIQQESRGNQFDSNGRPLTSRAGAIGQAQVMPQTAQEAADYAGVPFDDYKYRNDADYNTLLGKSYYNKMLKTFGDPILAAAAYNAGPAAVSNALDKQRTHGQSYLTFLPPETQNYVSKVGGSADDVPDLLHEPQLKMPSTVHPQQPQDTTDYGAMGFGDVARQGVANLPSSVGHLAANIYEAAVHPLDTAHTLYQLGVGLNSKIDQFAGKSFDPKDQNLVNALMNSYADKYGSIAGLKKAIATDPASVLLDLSTVLSGGATAAGAASKALGSVGALSDVAEAAGAVSNGLGMAAKATNVLDPFGVVSGGIKAAAGLGPRSAPIADVDAALKNATEGRIAGDTMALAGHGDLPQTTMRIKGVSEPAAKEAIVSSTGAVPTSSMVTGKMAATPEAQAAHEAVVLNNQKVFSDMAQRLSGGAPSTSDLVAALDRSRISNLHNATGLLNSAMSQPGAFSSAIGGNPLTATLENSFQKYSSIPQTFADLNNPKFIQNGVRANYPATHEAANWLRSMLPGADTGLELNGRSIAEIRQHLNSFFDQAQGSDRIALRALIDGFDDHIATAAANGMWAGGDGVKFANDYANGVKAYRAHREMYMDPSGGDNVISALSKNLKDLQGYDAAGLPTVSGDAAKYQQFQGPVTRALMDPVKGEATYNTFRNALDPAGQIEIDNHMRQSLLGLDENGRIKLDPAKLDAAISRAPAGVFTPQEQAQIRLLNEARRINNTRPSRVHQRAELLSKIANVAPGVVGRMAAMKAGAAFGPVGEYTALGAAEAASHALKGMKASQSAAKEIRGAPMPGSMLRRGLGHVAGAYYSPRLYDVVHEAQQIQQPHATGGRIERASGGRAGLDHKSAAEALMRAAERAKKAENETTEPLLNLPDEAITKALSAANEAI